MKSNNLEVGKWYLIKTKNTGTDKDYKSNSIYAFRVLERAANTLLESLLSGNKSSTISLRWKTDIQSHWTTIYSIGYLSAEEIEAVEATPEQILNSTSEYEVGDWVKNNWAETRQIVGKVFCNEKFYYALSSAPYDVRVVYAEKIEAANYVNDHNKCGFYRSYEILDKVEPSDLHYQVGSYVQCENFVGKIIRCDKTSRGDFTIDVDFSQLTEVNGGLPNTNDKNDPLVESGKYRVHSRTYYTTKGVNPSIKDVIVLYDFDPTKDSLFKNKENKMANQKDPKAKPSTMDMIKNDAEKALYRVGARRISQASKDAIVSLLKSHRVKKSQINAIVELLDTELGHAAVSLFLGMILPKLPKLGEDPRMKKICEEFRIEGMAIAGEELLDVVLESLGPTLKEVVRALPMDKPKVRVDADVPKTLKVVPDEESEPETEEKVEKKAKVITLPSKAEVS